jgi:FkbM family methyltransferase
MIPSHIIELIHLTLYIDKGNKMSKRIRNYIKTKPRLYDFLNSVRPINSKIERWIYDFSKKNNKKVNFIQIGANDGLRGDPIRRFVINDKWNGVFVEPLPNVFNILKSNYAYAKNQTLVFVNAAISSKDNECIEIWSYSDQFCDGLSLEEKLFYLRKSSFDKKHVAAHIKNFEIIDEAITCFKVQCISMNSLIQNYWRYERIDLIVIDAEGHDDVIIKSLDFTKIRPKAIIFESGHLSNGRKHDLFDLLKVNGYKILEMHGNSIAELS